MMRCEYCKNNFEDYETRKRKFCSMACKEQGRTKPYIIKNGYKLILNHKHERADSYGYVREHIIVMETVLGRKLKKKEVIHHKDGNKLNNSKNNLILFASSSAHMRFHHSLKDKKFKEVTYYTYRTIPNHPRASKTGRVAEHHLVMESMLGRFLNKSEVVHHIDNNKHNNKPENLMLFPDNSSHVKYHMRLRKENPQGAGHSPLGGKKDSELKVVIAY